MFISVNVVCIFGEGNGNPLQYSCLRISGTGEPGGRPAMGSQSRTQLKRLSMRACIGERNGNPLQYSCLENPRDRGTWWAGIYGVPQSRTRLKQLSSSNPRTCYISPSVCVVSYFFDHCLLVFCIQVFHLLK